MPKIDINYSNTIIYKITSKNINIKELYVGYTTNFIQKKHTHKQWCTNEKSRNYNCKLYEFIRNNGDWNNWTMEIVDCFNCKNHYEAKKKEQEYVILLNATLNNNNFLPLQKSTLEINNISNYELSTKHSENSENNKINYECLFCNFKCIKKHHIIQHFNTQKHKLMKINNVEKSINNVDKIFKCDCGKNYKERTGLWKHKKICKQYTKVFTSSNNNIEQNEILDKDQLILMLIKQNSQLIQETTDFKNIMMEVIKSGTHNNINSNNTNCNNKSFNLQFFLNETCKDAMNIMDFVNSIKLQLSDLENVGKVGFVNGISKIIIKNLNALDETQRPVHCTDKKREVIYVKDEDKWEKDEDDYKKIRRAIKVLAKRNSKLLFDFKDKYPECLDGESKYSDKYNKLFIEAYGGSGNHDIDNENKIIKNLSKEILIDKYEN